MIFGKKKDQNKYADKYKYSGYKYGGDSAEISLFSVQEAYKSIRTNLVLSVIKDGCKTIVFTSSIPSEGKSTTSVNVAISLSKAFFKVLLIDCDLRKPRIHRALDLTNNVGLSNVLSGLDTIEMALQQSKKYENLHVLSSGLIAPNPSEMLASDRMSKLLAELRKSYDYIIIDTPPINVVADALPIIKQSDGVILIVRQEHTTHNELSKAIKSLQFIDARIIGIVMNAADTRKRKKYKDIGKYVDKINYEDSSDSDEDDESELHIADEVSVDTINTDKKNG